MTTEKGSVNANTGFMSSTIVMLLVSCWDEAFPAVWAVRVDISCYTRGGILVLWTSLVTLKIAFRNSGGSQIGCQHICINSGPAKRVTRGLAFKIYLVYSFRAHSRFLLFGDILVIISRH